MFFKVRRLVGAFNYMFVENFTCKAFFKNFHFQICCGLICLFMFILIYIFQLHIVMHLDKFANIGEALHQPDGLAVLGYLIDVSL